MAIRTMALVLAAGASVAGAEETPLFELVPVPPEYAAAPTPTPTPVPHKRTIRRAAARPAPAPVDLPPMMAVQPPPPPEAIRTPPIAPPAPPPPTSWVGTRLQPIDPGTWVTNDDYPKPALHTGQAGTVGFALHVDGTGAVSGCDVRASSGSDILDATTCALLRRRAKFLPARDGEGRPIPAIYMNRLRWEIPDAPSVPMASWSSTLRFTIADDSQVTSCGYQGYGAPTIEERSPCVEISEVSRAIMRRLRGDAKGPVTIAVRFDHEVAGMPLPRVPALSPRFGQVAELDGSYQVEINGSRSHCAGTIDDHPLPIPGATCQSFVSYGVQGEVHSVTATIRFFSDGDVKVAAVLPSLGTPTDW